MCYEFCYFEVIANVSCIAWKIIYDYEYYFDIIAIVPYITWNNIHDTMKG